jgi:predicted nucleic acid-binding Zn ribbon protein
MNTKKCIVCEKNLATDFLEKHEVQFCSEACLKIYEEKLKKLSEVVNWENCC